MKALGLVVSDKKIFENCILKTYFLTLWPTYATNWNGLNNFDRGPPRDHSWEVWSISNEWFQRRRCLSKKVYGGRTTHDRRRTKTDDGQRPVTIAHPEHFVLRWAKKAIFCIKIFIIFYSINNKFQTEQMKQLSKQTTKQELRVSEHYTPKGWAVNK
jgi:hypothetical protein